MLPNIEEIRAALKDRNLRHIARECGVDYFILCRIRNGKATNPSYATIKAIVDYLKTAPKL